MGYGSGRGAGAPQGMATTGQQPAYGQPPMGANYAPQAPSTPFNEGTSSFGNAGFQAAGNTGFVPPNMQGGLLGKMGGGVVNGALNAQYARQQQPSADGPNGPYDTMGGGRYGRIAAANGINPAANQYAPGTSKSSMMQQGQQRMANQLQGYKDQGAAGNWDPYANNAISNLSMSQWDPASYGAIQAQLNDRIQGGQQFQNAAYGPGGGRQDTATGTSISQAQDMLAKLQAMQGAR